MKLNELRQLIREEISKAVNENERLNPRQQEIAPGVINYYFDEIDTVDLDNGYKVKIVRTFYYRTPGTKGYSEKTNSEENPGISDGSAANHNCVYARFVKHGFDALR